MAANSQSTARQVVPRWRVFREALAANELASTDVGKGRQIDGSEFIAEKEQAWQKNKELPFAIDLVSAASVLGTTPVANDAATFILENASRVSAPAERIARTVLGIEEPKKPETPPQSRQQMIQRVKDLKSKRIQQPRNAFVWVDLARLYVLLGQNESARQCLKVAHMLAPSERFVVRSTARFLHHIKENDEAVEFLRKNARTPFDSWLMAAEIAASAVAEKTPKFAKAGEHLLKSGAQPFHTSELASALASLEMESGNHRAAKKLFRESLVQPTDNALAQAVWASKRTNIDEINPTMLENSRANEALTWSAFNNGNWKDVIFHADRWAIEEAFSARPLVLASSIAASLLDKHALGEELALRGLSTNPGHPALVNNVAFSLILKGEPAKALQFLDEANLTNIRTQDIICLLATTGLAHYRLGDESSGTKYYEAAIERASGPDHVGLKAAATLYMGRERALLGLKDGIIQFKKAYETAAKLKATHLPALAKHMARDVQKIAERLAVPFDVEVEEECALSIFEPNQLILPSAELLPPAK